MAYPAEHRWQPEETGFIGARVSLIDIQNVRPLGKPHGMPEPEHPGSPGNQAGGVVIIVSSDVLIFDQGWLSQSPRRQWVRSLSWRDAVNAAKVCN
jgi:hypothetical protein